jgi:hypothetical protein
MDDKRDAYAHAIRAFDALDPQGAAAVRLYVHELRAANEEQQRAIQALDPVRQLIEHVTAPDREELRAYREAKLAADALQVETRLTEARTAEARVALLHGALPWLRPLAAASIGALTAYILRLFGVPLDVINALHPP